MTKKIVNNFKHRKGKHCESTSMRDIIEQVGIPISEPMAFGLDATMGFVFFDSTTKTSASSQPVMDMPFFIGGKQGTITKDSLACRILGLTIREETFQSPNEAWLSSTKYLEQNIPLIIMADMYYLTYFEWKEDFHFGRHSIVLCGYDDKKDVALVCDNNFDEVLEISIEQLKKARNSKYGPTFLQPYNSQYIIRHRPDGKRPPFPAAVKLAIQQVSKNMRAVSINSQGLTALKIFAKSIPKWQDILKAITSRPYDVIEMLYGYIEEYGTGGGLFRKLYSTFLNELSENDEILTGPRAWNSKEISLLNQSFEMIKESGDLWSEFASCLKSALNTDRENCLDLINTNKLVEIINKIIPLEEAAFKNLSQIKL
ncbi:MAG: BtrH N-terminal domain-containing protein [Candidatus Helarchaeota archaeon]